MRILKELNYKSLNLHRLKRTNKKTQLTKASKTIQIDKMLTYINKK